MSRAPLLSDNTAAAAASAETSDLPEAFPDAALWIDAIRAGDFETAWRINDAGIRRRSLPGCDKHSGPRHLQHIWDGSSLRDKRVLVRCYHGLGDTIQFARFLAPLRTLAREVIVWCQPALVNLLGRVDGVDRVLPLHDAAPDVSFDVDIEIMELAHALRVTRQDLWRGPYLNVQNGSPQTSVSPGPPTLAVGLAWKAGDWDSRRSLPLSEVTRLCKELGIEFHSLQPAAATCATAAWINETLDVSSIDALLRAMHQLDLVISVDTMAAHLAGAAGFETWTLLIDDCDWRWPRRGATTPWYPTMQLFHQQRAGDWPPVIDSLAEALRKRAQVARSLTKMPGLSLPTSRPPFAARSRRSDATCPNAC